MIGTNTPILTTTTPHYPHWLSLPTQKIMTYYSRHSIVTINQAAMTTIITTLTHLADFSLTVNSIVPTQPQLRTTTAPTVLPTTLASGPTALCHRMAFHARRLLASAPPARVLASGSGVVTHSHRTVFHARYPLTHHYTTTTATAPMASPTTTRLCSGQSLLELKTLS